MTEAVTVFRILLRGGLATLWPWLILAISFGANLAVYVAVGDNPQVVRQSGGILALFLTAVAANQQAWTQVLPFTLGLSGTRRGFLGGMTLFVVAQAILTGLLLTALTGVEILTDGWGVEMRFFRTPVLDDLAPAGRVAVLAALMLAVCGFGAVLGAVLVRWGSAGLWWLLAGGGLLVGVVVVSAVASGWWGSVLGDLVARPWAQVWLFIPLVVASGGALFAWFIVRRVEVR
jgi:hypothetical protein